MQDSSVSADQRRLGPASPQPMLPSASVIFTSTTRLPSSSVRDGPRGSVSTAFIGRRTGKTSIFSIAFFSGS